MSRHPGLGLIWAQAEGRVIGRDGGMPWHVPEDLAHFREMTASAPVIMGRRTWESLPERFRPLPGRANIVVSRDRSLAECGAVVVDSLDAALERAGDGVSWVIGGGALYAEALPRAGRIEVTELELRIDDGDTLAPEIPAEDWTATAGPWLHSSSGVAYRFVGYRAEAVAGVQGDALA